MDKVGAKYTKEKAIECRVQAHVNPGDEHMRDTRHGRAVVPEHDSRTTRPVHPPRSRDGEKE